MAPSPNDLLPPRLWEMVWDQLGSNRKVKSKFLTAVAASHTCKAFGEHIFLPTDRDIACSRISKHLNDKSKPCLDTRGYLSVRLPFCRILSRNERGSALDQICVMCWNNQNNNGLNRMTNIHTVILNIPDPSTVTAYEIRREATRCLIRHVPIYSTNVERWWR
jgi:hypothetical protein